MSKVPWDRWFRLRLDRNEGNERGNTLAARHSCGEEEEEEEEFLRADTAGIIENIFASFHRPFPCVSSFDRVTRWRGDLKSWELNAKRRERDKLPAAKFPAIQLGFWSNVNCFRYRSLSSLRWRESLYFFSSPSFFFLFYLAINRSSMQFEYSVLKYYTRCFTQWGLVIVS